MILGIVQVPIFNFAPPPTNNYQLFISRACRFPPKSVYFWQEVLKEITETDVVLRIEPLHKSRFAYALMPGTEIIHWILVDGIWQHKPCVSLMKYSLGGIFFKGWVPFFVGS